MKISSLYLISSGTIFAIISAMSVNAQENELFYEVPVVLTASRLEQPVSEAPVAITSIDRQMIEASGARTIPDVLRLVPGMIVGNSASEFGDEPKIVVAYHGHTDQFSKQMQVLIDGRSIYEPLRGGVAWNMIPINIEDIERIEVSRGPNAPTYGSNSFLAVVNIITRHAAEDKGHFIKAVAGNHDIADATYRFGGSSDDLDYRFTLSSQNDDGQDTVSGEDNHDDVGANAFDYRMDYQIDNNKTLTYQGGYSLTTLDINENFAADGIRPVRESETINAHQYLKFENTLNTDNSFVIQYYYNLLDKEDDSISKVFDPAILGLPFDPFTIPLELGFRSERQNLEFTHFNQTTDDLRTVWGLSAQQDVARSSYWLPENETIRREIYRIFANAEWRLNQDNIVNAGLLLEKTENKGTDNSPRIVLIHKIDNKQSLRFGISKAIRAPFIAEEHGDSVLSQEVTIGGAPVTSPPFSTTVDAIALQQYIPNPNIEQEEILSREIGYYGRFYDDDFLINIRLFRDRLENLVEDENEPVTFSEPNVLLINNLTGGETTQFLNTQKTTVKGLEIELDYYVDDSLRIFGSLGYLDINAEDGGALINSAPDYTGSLLIIKKFNVKYSGSIATYYVDDMSWADAHRGDKSNNYTTMDLRLARKIRTGSGPAELSIVLKNVLDEYNNYDPNPDNGPLLEQNLIAYIDFRISIQ